MCAKYLILALVNRAFTQLSKGMIGKPIHRNSKSNQAAYILFNMPISSRPKQYGTSDCRKKQNPKCRIGLSNLFAFYFFCGLLYLIISHCGCKEIGSRDNKNYITRSSFAKADTILLAKGRNQALRYLDSLIATKPFLSTNDSFNYYLHKSKIYQFRHLEEKFTDSAYINIVKAIGFVNDSGKITEGLRKEYVFALSSRAELGMYLRKYSEAFSSLAKSKYMNLEDGDSCLAGDNSALQALIFYQQKKYDNAVLYFKAALSLFESCKNDGDKFYRLQGHLDNLALSFSKMNKSDSALKYYFKAEQYILQNMELCKTNPDFPVSALMVVYGNIADEYQIRKEYDNAIKYLRKTTALRKEELYDTVIDYAVKMQFAELYTKSGNFSEAMIYAATVNAAQLKLDIYKKAAWYKTMAELSAGLKRNNSELNYLNLYLKASDSIGEQQKGLLEADPQALFEEMENKTRMALLRKDSEIQRVYLLLAAGILTVLSLYAFTMFKNYRSAKKVTQKMAALNDELTLRESELKKLMQEREIQQKKEKEDELALLEMKLDFEYGNKIQEQRGKISDDMHDELCSSLAALNYYICDIRQREENKGADHLLGDLLAETEMIYKNARQYMHSLKSNYWNTAYSLTEYLSNLAQKLSEKSLAPLLLVIDKEAVDGLTWPQQGELRHVIKEAIANALKHSGAKEIRVQIWVAISHCNFTISDTGTGFNISNVVPGLGLKSMQTRIEKLNGSLKITSDPNGTTLTGSFPLDSRPV